MLASRGEAGAVVRGLLSDMLDARLQQYGYTRRGTSLKYLRAVPGGYQSVEFMIFLRPRYASPMSHVSIDAVLRFGPLMELARAMMADAAILENRGDLALRRPIDALRPGNAPLWLFDDEGSLAVHGERIVSDLEEYVLPFLSGYGSLSEYVETQSSAYASIGETLADDPLLLAAAVILTDGSYERAWDVLTRHYPDGSRGSELYRGATDYVATRLNQNEAHHQPAASPTSRGTPRALRIVRPPSSTGLRPLRDPNDRDDLNSEES